jgi:anaerobic magnesium-protoporphyrin IX monomethyl ester cyclase
MPLMDFGKLWGKSSRGAGNNNFNYGLAAIAGWLRHHGYAVEILDPQFFPQEADLMAKIAAGQYDVVGITSFTPTVTGALRMVELVRRTLPSTTIVLGGPHCAYFPLETLDGCPELDYVVAGEGELPMLELVRFLESGTGTPEQIAGLVWRKNGKAEANPRPTFLNVDDLPMPAYDLFSLDKYTLQPTVYKRLPTLTTLVSRGCPFSCTFCEVHEVLGRKMRYRDVELVLDELEFMMEKFGTRGFFFHDSTFTVNRGWVERFCERIIERELDFSWACLTRVNSISPDLLRRMKRAGCYGISFGIESANQKTLDFLEKKSTVEQNVAAIRMAKQAGLYVTATYMIGVPGEDEADVLRTIQFAKDNPTHISHFFWPLPYPRTRFFKQCQDDGGIIDNPTWESYNLYAENPVYVNPRIGKTRMHELHALAYRSYYLSPQVIYLNLRSIDCMTDVKKYAQAALAVVGMMRRN